MKKLLSLGFCLFIFAHSANAQNSISGYIISLETARPIVNATVYLHDKYNLALKNSEPLRATTDSSGFYKIAGIKSDTYIINTWTTYRAMNQQYAMILQTDRIEIDGSISVDFVFSENAFKYALHTKHHLQDLFKKSDQSSDAVARKAVRPQLYIDHQQDTVYSWRIESMENVSK